MASTISRSREYLPYFAEGTVVAGFGRGSKELGIPTANFPEEVIRRLPEQFECGVYYGWAKVGCSDEVYKMVMCVGWNPYYHNTVKTMETHIMHKFDADFYGDHLKIVVLGFIRPMCDFKSLDELITAIHQDIASANRQLDTGEHLRYKEHQFFSSSAPAPSPCVAGDTGTTAPAASGDQKEEGTPVDEKRFQSQLERGAAGIDGASCALTRDPETGKYIMSCNTSENHSSSIGKKDFDLLVKETSCNEGQVGVLKSKDVDRSCVEDCKEVEQSPARLVNGHVNAEEGDGSAMNHSNNCAASRICKL